MRSLFLTLSGIFFLFCIVLSCKKEKSFEDPVSKGSLQSDTTGDCLPSTFNGVYAADSALVDTVNYITLEADITKTGTYTIASDTVDGIYFRSEGNVNVLGLVTFQLAGHGKPTAAGTYTLNITYGTTTCSKEFTISGGATGGSSNYTVADMSGNCPTPVFAGTYMAGVALDATNTLSFDVHVAVPGTYTFNIEAGSDITFTGSGMFTDTGSHTVILQGSGTPQAEGDVTASVENCTFPLTIVANNLPDAAYTLNCGSAQLSGTYMAGTAMVSGNTATITATVATAGKYQLTTTAVNGVTFSATGTFPSVSATPQTIILTASGTPVNAGNFTYNLSGNGATCSFPVTFAAAPAAAIFTFAGSPDACTNATVNGTYTAGTALSGSNSVGITVDVTAIGTYSITTNTANNLTFSGSGSFTQTGTQVVTLQASGTPDAGGTLTFTPQSGAISTCSFDVTVADAPPVQAGTFACKIDGVAMTFNDRAQATNGPDLNNEPELYLDGYTAPANGGYIPELQISVTTTDGSAITTGTYDEKHLIPPGRTYSIAITYHVVNADNSVTLWTTGSNFLSPNPPFTIVVTSLTATRVQGTFSGKLSNQLEGSTGSKTVTEGTFDLPIVP